MTTLIVPPVDEQPWPTLGPQVCDLLEARAVFGPGDLRGEPARIDAETRALIYRMYEVFPKTHPKAGKRRFKRVGLSMRKGTAKTEKAAWIAYAELHPEGPVRCDGWRRNGKAWEPVGAPIRDPYIPMVAYTEEQTEDLAYGALYAIVTEGPDVDLFDPGLERIMRIGGDGKAVALASAPDARDGARTTFQHFDETHRFTLPRLKEAHRTMLANIPKRPIADPWSLETTTAPAPGEGSIAEETMDYARHIATGAVADPRLFYFHRAASEKHDLDTDDGVRAAVLEASGPYAEWSDVDGIVEQIRSASPANRPYLERVWLNRLVRDSEQAFDAPAWKLLASPQDVVRGALIVLGFDGSRREDATALIATVVETGYQFVLGIWERPPRAKSWEVDEAAVDVAVAEAFDTYTVWRMYADPPYWETKVSEWAGRYGKERVHEWATWRQRPMAYALRGYATAIEHGELTHDGNEQMASHLGNARKRLLTLRDETGDRLWLIQKERPDSPMKIDAAMAGCLSWEARMDALVANAIGQVEQPPNLW